MSETHHPPQPDPALRRLDRFVGSWTMEVISSAPTRQTSGGETTFRWLPGGSLGASSRAAEASCSMSSSLITNGCDPTGKRPRHRAGRRGRPARILIADEPW
jgi:hypothetical protein